MSILKCLWKGIAFVAFASLPLCGQNANKGLKRDPQAIEILNRTIQASGGRTALASVHDITEKGEITFHWGKGVKGPVTIEMLSVNHFRLEYELGGHKTTWTVVNGLGSDETEGKKSPISHTRAMNLGGITFPAMYAEAAITDSLVQVSFAGIEKQGARFVYRVRLSGDLRPVAKVSDIPLDVTKDLIIDALTYDILNVEDWPLSRVKKHGTRSQVAQRQIEYGNFRSVNGVRVPSFVEIRLLGQTTTTILLNDVSFNSDLRDEDFGL